MRRRLVAVAGAALVVAVAGATSGCADLGYLLRSAGGHMELLQRARPVDELLSDPATPPRLAERLRLAQRLRAFAVAELKLPDTASYRRYAALDRDAVVWNVVAAPELGLTPKVWCFPVAGCVSYRGFFRREDAEAEAAALRAASPPWETQINAVPAYSTLGKTDWLGGDPLLSTFVGWPEDDLAGLLFHEMAHAAAYASDDSTFNESYATAVERLGLRRWRAHTGRAPDVAADALRAQRRADFRALMARTRGALAQVYGGPGDDAARRAQKARLMAAMRDEYAVLKRERWGGFAGYDETVARTNNASLASLGTYDDLVPAFESLFERLGGDFARLHAEARTLAALPKAERRARLAGP
jgi:predicted aminopeptidase